MSSTALKLLAAFDQIGGFIPGAVEGGLPFVMLVPVLYFARGSRKRLLLAYHRLPLAGNICSYIYVNVQW